MPRARLRVRYRDPGALVADWRDELAARKLTVYARAPRKLKVGEEVDLELDLPGAALTLKVRIEEVLDDGVRVHIPERSVPYLSTAVERARDLAPRIEDLTEHDFVSDESQAPRSLPGPPSLPRPGVEPDVDRAKDGGSAEKIKAALSGNREQRMRLLRSSAHALHPFVLKNPGLQLDEVVAAAKMTHLSLDLLSTIASRREWVEDSAVAAALVRNPKFPVKSAIDVLRWVSPSELRKIVKDPHARDAVRAAARKMVFG